MARLRGDILLNDKVLYTDLDIILHESRRGMYNHWNGYFSVPVGQEPKSSHEYSLSLDDGRIRQIIIASECKPRLGESHSRIEFVGTGPISS